MKKRSYEIDIVKKILYIIYTRTLNDNFVTDFKVPQDFMRVLRGNINMQSHKYRLKGNNKSK